jgi:hypothetical protein
MDQTRRSLLAEIIEAHGGSIAKNYKLVPEKATTGQT